MMTIPNPHHATGSDHEAGPTSGPAESSARLIASWVCAQPTVRAATTEGDWRQAQELLHDYAAWVDASIGADLAREQPDFVGELTDLANAYRFPGGAFLVADDGFAICGVVAIRRHDDSAELKRLYVRPAARGAGWADQLVAQAIGTATMLGASRIWLETLPGLMDPAIALYRRHGFDTVEDQPTIGVDGVIVMERDLRG